MKNLKEFSKEIKNYLPLILLLPAILGGLWQLFELSRMSISFIRFFSPTQLLPDGLLMLFIIGVLFLSYKLGNIRKKPSLNKEIFKIYDEKPLSFSHFFVKVNKINKLAKVNNYIYNRDKIVTWVLLIIFELLILIVISYQVFNIEFHFLAFSIWFIFIVKYGKSILFSLFVLYVHFIESTYFISVKKFFMKSSIFKDFFLILPLKILGTVLVFAVFLFPIIIASFFHQRFFLPDNLKNLDYIQSSLHNTDYNQSKISYFNDKYIFIIHHNGDKNSTIEILKFDKLFE